MAAGLIVPALEGLGAAAAWGYRALQGYRLYQGAKRLEEMSRTGNTVLNEAKPDDCTGNCEKAKKEPKKPEDIIGSAERDTKTPTLKDGTEQYNKEGGMPSANEDFDSMQPQNVQPKGLGVRVGDLADGTQIVARPRSVPSLEINPSSGPPSIIRYR